MARETSLPAPSTFIQDFGLNVTPPPSVRNKRVVIIGTSEDGPMYQPILIDKPEDAEFVWGRFGIGDLVRGIYECWNVQTGYPTVVGVRIGNGKVASLTINEAPGVGADSPQPTTTASLQLNGLYPGQVYNQITIGYDESRNVRLYNPKTGQASLFSIDTTHPTNPDVQAHNVSELVDAINADRNASNCVVASFTPLLSDFEIEVNANSNCVSQTPGQVTISLFDALNDGNVTTSGYMINDPIGTGVTSSNNLINLITSESVSISEWEQITTAGSNVTQLDFTTLDGKAPGATWKTIQALEDYNGDGVWTTDPKGKAVSEYIYVLNNELMDGGTGEGGITVSGGLGANNQFDISNLSLCPDDSENTSTANIASGYINANKGVGQYYANYSGNWTYATCQAIADKDDVNGNPYRPSGILHVYVANTLQDTFLTELPYDTQSGVYLSSYSGGIATFSIGSQVSNISNIATRSNLVNGIKFSNILSIVDTNAQIIPGKILRLSGNTVKGNLAECQNLNEVTAPSTSLTSYFVAGQKIQFNYVPAFDMIINYGTRVQYELGATVDITDIANGFITWSVDGSLPGPGGGALLGNITSYIRFRYTYMPNWPNITSAAQALTGGTNGNVLTNLQRFTELDKAYTNLRNYQADIFVPMNGFIDATSQSFNPTTGLREQVVVGFQDQLTDFLDDLSINSIQPHAILGVTPMVDTTQASKDAWVTLLTQADPSNPNNTANLMNLIQNKFISVAAFEPLFLNIGRGRPYTANGQAAYAGQIASMPYNLSPTNKEVQSVGSLRFELSTSQYEALNSMRFVIMKTRPGRNPVIVEDVTAAPFGSDYVNWSTFSITAEACNRVRAIAQEFIGRPNSVEVRSSLDQLISNGLMSMDGLRGFDFSITSSPNQQVLGIIEVDLTLVPIFTIKKIRTTVKLRKNLPTTTA